MNPKGLYCSCRSVFIRLLLVTILAALILLSLHHVVQYLRASEYKMLYLSPSSPFPSETAGEHVHAPSSLQRDCGFELESVLNASPDTRRNDGQYCNVLEAMTAGKRVTYGGQFEVPNCPLKWFQRDLDAGNLCKLLPRWGRIVVVGDSYMRQLTQAMWMIAADDFERGGMAPSLAENVTYDNCTCDLLFTRSCRALARVDFNGTY